MNRALLNLGGALLLLAAGCSTSTGGGTSGGMSVGSSNSSGGSSSGKGTSSAASSSGSSGTSGLSSSGTDGNGSSGSSSGSVDGGCANAPAGELQPCQDDSDCGCSLSCVEDPLLGSACEYSCTTTTDCDNPGTICQHALCQAIACSDYDGPCDALGTNDGSCIPYDNPDGGRVGICQQGGTAPLFGCDYVPSRSNPSGLCPVGTYCWTEGYSAAAAPDPDDTVCRPLCNPLTTTTCTNGGVCASGIQLDDGSAFGSPDQAFGLCSLAIPQTESGFVQAENTVFPQVPDNGGSVIATPELVTITFQGDPLQQVDEAWGAWAVQSQEWLAVVGADYGVGLGSVAANVEIPSPPMGLAVTNAEAYLLQEIEAGVIPSPPGELSNYVYMIYYPSDVTVMSADGSVGCVDWAGYHNELTSGTLDFAYAVIADCPPYDLGDAEAENVEATAAHELIEVATDPFFQTTNGAYYVSDPGSAWYYEDLGTEVADLCVVNTTDIIVFDGGFAAQRIWSNSLAAKAQSSPCAPIPTGEIYANAVIPTSEVALLGAGGSVTFPVEAWSNAPLAWPVNVVQTSAAPPTLGMTLDFPSQPVTNGAQGALTLTVPASTAPGTIFTVELESQSSAQYAYWPITISVPSAAVAAGAPVGCTAPADGGVDPCLASGTLCTPPAGATSLDGTCALPNELDPCLASLGCAGALVCQATPDGGLCLQPCTSSSDCADPTTACLIERGQQACWPNACGPGTANGTAYFGSCNATGTGDGTCLPSGASGLCLASGAVATGQSCQFARAAGPSPLCSAGDICVGSSEGRNLSLCEPLCDPDGGSPTCSPGEACAPVFGREVGACTQLCGDGGSACPTNTTCTLIPPSNDLCSW